MNMYFLRNSKIPELSRASLDFFNFVAQTSASDDVEDVWPVHCVKKNFARSLGTQTVHYKHRTFNIKIHRSYVKYILK